MYNLNSIQTAAQSIQTATFTYRGRLSYSIPIQLGDKIYTPTSGHDFEVEICYMQAPFPSTMQGDATNYDIIIRVDGISGMIISDHCSDAVLLWPYGLSGNGSTYNGWRFLSGDFPDNTFKTNQSTLNLKINLVDQNGVEYPYTLGASDPPILICLRANFNNNNN